jgi:pimeloyl-ACP methyl ester carboxylesterase
MSTVLVHGVPETAAVWDPLVEALSEAGVPPPRRWSPPGFGAAVPPGFAPSPTAYRDLLVAELEQVGEPVDLVGHDWGGTHVLSVAMTRPDLIRTWATDTGGSLDPDYVWHELAQTWQTPGDGEAAIAAMLALSDDDRAAFLVGRGMAAATAAVLSPAFDATMGDCILRLYRAAAQPAMVELGRGLERAAARPGLMVLATDDHNVGTDAQRRRSAARAGAQVAELEGCGHWWMTTDPVRGARVLTRFWNGGCA